MRIIYFHQYFSTPAGAGTIRSYGFAKRLVECGHTVTMVCGSPDRAKTGLTGPFRRGRREGMVEGIRVVELELPSSNQDSFLKRTITFLRFALRSTLIVFTENFDLVFATSTPLTAGIPGIAASLLRRKKFVFEVRDLWPELPREMGVITNPLVLVAMGALEWLSYHSAVRCIGLSPGIVKGIIRRGIDPKKIAMIPNGCDLDIFRPPKIQGRRPEGFSEDDFIAIFAGAHGIANGLDALLDVARELVGRGRQDIKLLFVGNGKLKPALMERAEEEGLTNCVFWDPIPKADLARLFQGVDAGLMILANVPAFYYGTSPNKFFDYIAAGLPVVNNYPGWLADMIDENKCGMAVPPEDPVVFADTLVYMAGNKQEVQGMGMRSRSLAERVFDCSQQADKFVNWIEGASGGLSVDKEPHRVQGGGSRKVRGVKQ